MIMTQSGILCGTPSAESWSHDHETIRRTLTPLEQRVGHMIMTLLVQTVILILITSVDWFGQAVNIHIWK